MLVAPGLHLVDGVARGMVNAYLWERPDGGLTLIDTGMPADAPRILAYVKALNHGQRLDRIIVTHADIDHIGGLAAVQEATGARVVCHAVEKAVVEGRAPRILGASLLARAYGPVFNWFTRAALHYRPVQHVDELVLDKQTLPEGFQVVHVPGHTAGQIALFEPQRGILIVADALNNSRGNGQFGPPMPLATPHQEVARQSVRKLAELKGIQLICFGHGQPVYEQAAERLQAYAASLPV